MIEAAMYLNPTMINLSIDLEYNPSSRKNIHEEKLRFFEKKFLNDALKFIPFGIVFSTIDWKNIWDNYGLAGGPEIDYYPFDGLEIALGAYLIDGKGNNLFSNVKDFDEMFLKVKYNF